MNSYKKYRLSLKYRFSGSLFRSTEFTRRETELIIIVTAYLVQPTRLDSMPLPTDGLIPLSDVERLLALPRI
ncbi:hypothetical protein O9993_15965 [Vibrio lentus]|nr:hypothetical protein [Vibrio lentus]